MNRNNNLFVQDYGIKRKGRLITEEAYNQNNQSIDHLWLYETNKYYALAMELIHQRVKFSANVVPYYKINRNNNLFVQDYGIKRKGRLITEEAYNQNNQ
ncbi:hypothetical protein ACSE35_04635, partial [Staphylococcus aureus]